MRLALSSALSCVLSILSILWLLDAPLLAALAHVPVNDRPLSFLQPPEATPPRLVAAALLLAACLLLVLAVTTLCLAVWLCNFAVAYYYPIGELLWMCLAAHSFLLYKLSRVWLHDTPWGVLCPTEWTMRRSPEPVHGATMASVFCAVGAVVVFLAVNAGGPGGGWLPDFSLGFAFWGPHGLDPSGLTFLLALALLYDGLVLAKLARVSYHHFNTGDHVDSLLRPCVAQRGLAAGGAAALLLLAFTVLVLSGIPLSRAFSPSPLGNLLGTVCPHHHRPSLRRRRRRHRPHRCHLHRHHLHHPRLLHLASASESASIPTAALTPTCRSHHPRRRRPVSPSDPHPPPSPLPVLQIICVCREGVARGVAYAVSHTRHTTCSHLHFS